MHLNLDAKFLGVQVKYSPTKTKLCLTEKMFSISLVVRCKLTKIKSFIFSVMLARFQGLHGHTGSCRVRWQRSKCPRDTQKRRKYSLCLEWDFPSSWGDKVYTHIYNAVQNESIVTGSKAVNVSPRGKDVVYLLACCGWKKKFFCFKSYNWTQGL